MADYFSIIPSSNDFDDDGGKEDDIYPEASHLFKILVIYELPHGTGLHMTFTLDPNMTTSALKNDLANIVNIPAEFVHLIHQNRTLKDDKTLQGQGVETNNTIVLRDLRLTYTFP